MTGEDQKNMLIQTIVIELLELSTNQDGHLLEHIIT
jgi:hypothetical protein